MSPTPSAPRPIHAEPDAYAKVALLLQSAVHRSHLAAQAIAQEDAERCKESVLSAMQIVDALHAALDPAAGELAQRLEYLYSYVGLRLVEGYGLQDAAPIEEATALLAQIAAGWSSIPPESRRPPALAA